MATFKTVNRTSDKTGRVGCAFLSILVVLFLLVGEIRCIVKMCQCNWEPVGKAEVIYTVATFTGLGVIVGWINIEDK